MSHTNKGYLFSRYSFIYWNQNQTEARCFIPISTITIDVITIKFTHYSLEINHDQAITHRLTKWTSCLHEALGQCFLCDRQRQVVVPAFLNIHPPIISLNRSNTIIAKPGSLHVLLHRINQIKLHGTLNSTGKEDSGGMCLKPKLLFKNVSSSWPPRSR